jgi:hypothetical protein
MFERFYQGTLKHGPRLLFGAALLILLPRPRGREARLSPDTDVLGYA